VVHEGSYINHIEAKDLLPLNQVFYIYMKLNFFFRQRKHMSKVQSSIMWVAVPFCMGGIEIRGFSPYT